MAAPNPVSPKVTWPAVIGAAITLGVSIADSFGVSVPPAVQSSLHTLLAAAIGWLVTDPLRQPPA